MVKVQAQGTRQKAKGKGKLRCAISGVFTRTAEHVPLDARTPTSQCVHTVPEQDDKRLTWRTVRRCHDASSLEAREEDRRAGFP